MDNFKNMLNTIGFSDIIILMLSVFIPFFISIESEKAKKYKNNILGIIRSLDILLLDIDSNNNRISSIKTIAKEYAKIQTEDFGENSSEHNKKKKYWKNIIINDLNSIRTIDTIHLNNFVFITDNDDIILKIHQYNKDISDFKSMLSLYNLNKKYLNNYDLIYILDLITPILEKHSDILSSISKLKTIAVNETESLQKMTMKSINFSKLVLAILLIIFIVDIFGNYFWRFSILDIKIFKYLYWGLVILNVLVGLTYSKIILKE